MTLPNAKIHVFAPFEVAILYHAYKNNFGSLQQLQTQDEAAFKAATFNLKALGLINARYELTERGVYLFEHGEINQAKTTMTRREREDIENPVVTLTPVSSRKNDGLDETYDQN